jgi:hypothetical protein
MNIAAAMTLTATIPSKILLTSKNCMRHLSSL